jgi:hypothetical protein
VKNSTDTTNPETGERCLPLVESEQLRSLGFDVKCSMVHHYNDGCAFKPCHEIEEWHSDKSYQDVFYKRNSDCANFDDADLESNTEHDMKYVTAPTFAQVFKWFRETHRLSGIPTHQSYEVWDLQTSQCFIEEYPIGSHEESELSCVVKLIELVQNNNRSLLG